MALSFSFHSTTGWVEHEIKDNEIINIPRTPDFYINVIADNDRVESFWCDYFISNKETRNLKMKQLNENR